MAPPPHVDIDPRLDRPPPPLDPEVWEDDSDAATLRPSPTDATEMGSPEYSSIELMPVDGGDSNALDLLEDLDAMPDAGAWDATDPGERRADTDGEVLDLGDFEVE